MRVAIVLLATAACAEPAVEMKLVMPSSSTTPFDMSCVTAVDLLPVPNNDQKPLDIGYREETAMVKLPCVDLPHAPTSFDDVEAMIRGKFDMALPPEGLAAVEIRGRAGSCADMPAYHEAVFYGGGGYKAGDSLPIQVARNLSCDAGTSYTVHAVDLVATVQTKTCTDVTQATIPDSEIFSGVFRPTLMPDVPLLFETGPSFAALKTPTGQIDTFKSTWQGSCPAVGWDDAEFGMATCINTGTNVLNACAGATETELPVVDGPYFAASADPTLSQQFAGLVFGAVWTTTGTKGPVMGATVTLDQGVDGQVIYGDVGTEKFMPAMGATSTGASGMFVVYTNGLAGITINVPGKQPQHRWVGSDIVMVGSTMVVVN